MTTGTIIIRGSVYQGAQRYAKEHNVSLNTFVESIIVKAIGLDMPKRVKKNKFKLKSFDELSPRVRSLIVLAMQVKKSKKILTAEMPAWNILKRSTENDESFH